jgi:hypothetical protein
MRILKSLSSSSGSNCFSLMVRFAVVMLVLSTHLLSAQITGMPGVIDPNALPLDVVEISALYNKEWNCQKMIETRRGAVRESSLFTSVTFFDDGKFSELLQTGQWKVIDSKFISILPAHTKAAPRRYITGAYSIYKISDSTLVLGQVLTSSGDWKKEYWFTIQERVRPPYPRPALFTDTVLHEGERRVYDAQGRLTAIENYKIEKGRLLPLSMERYGAPSHHINLKDSTWIRSVRVGEWKTFYADGAVESITNYVDGRRVGDYTEFYPDGRFKKVRSVDGPYYVDVYEYPKNSTTPVVQRFGANEPVFALGSDECVEFDHLEFYVESATGKLIEEMLVVRNLMDHEVVVRVDGSDEFEVVRDTFRLPARDFWNIRLHLRIPQGITKGTITLSTNEWTYHMDVKSFGYDLSEADFSSRKDMELPSTFYYLRSGDEYQLEIDGRGANDRIIPISRSLNEVQLSPGKYKFQIVGTSGKKSANIRIK